MPGANASARCIASTDDLFKSPLAGSDAGRRHRGSVLSVKNSRTNFFHTTSLSADGTTIVARNDDQRTRTFVLPPDLLEQQGEVCRLTPYATSEPLKVRSSALYPHFSLSDPNTTLSLESQTDLAIRLVNVLDYGFVHGYYPWISPTTEEYITPHALLFGADGTRFVAGAKESIALFDISRPNERPLTSYKTRKSRKTRQSYGEHEIALSGIVNALAINPANGLLAAGSTDRQIGFWEAGGAGQKTSAFSIADPASPGLKGSGIIQIDWSSCGNYLFVAERNSNVILVYDIRQGRKLCWLRGRNAMGMQRLSFDLIQSASSGLDVWAGGVDGHVRLWTDVTSQMDGIDPFVDMVAHQDTVSNVLVHPSQAIFITASGHRRPPAQGLGLDDEEEWQKPKSSPDNTLKVWGT